MTKRNHSDADTANANDALRGLIEPMTVTEPVVAPVAPPTLFNDYQIANRRSFNFATRKTKVGIKTISLPALEIAEELAKREPKLSRIEQLRAELLVYAIEEFKRWEARVA